MQAENARLQHELHVALREANSLRRKLAVLERTDRGRTSQPDLLMGSDGRQRTDESTSHVPVECLSDSSNDAGVQRGAKKDVGALQSGTTQPATGSKPRSRKRRERSGNDTPGSTRYWSETEHRLFLEALKLYGHKNLKAISAYVGTRNMTQVRTHTQKYFMKLMREAKRRSATEDAAAGATGDQAPAEQTAEGNNDLRSVPEVCGVSLLSLVAEETFSQQ